ncbi:alpha/beta hydrolase [uncultured Lutibacter sp.]|uniref:dienelactone hydrolase family protein n=1 Tax=uncultured Lutibacter sp. TaxID=437739 RepID=UPI0026081D51|nr:alpha/beta hydrolase [uncultured Lutibacter sp.]
MNTIKKTYKEVDIKLDTVILKGNLRLANEEKGIIIFSHGSGSSRLSVRNNYVADILLKKRFSSLLFDLLTPEEDTIYENRFNIELLTTRLIKVTKWVQNYYQNKQIPIGYFGASTGAASAFNAAAKLNKTVKAIVSRGGRPDLASDILSNIKIPSLLIVGGNDGIVINLNKQAKAKIGGICELKIVNGASHLFSEPGKLEIVANLSSQWFNNYLNK